MFKLPEPLPLPRPNPNDPKNKFQGDVRATGFTGDITRYPLSVYAYLYRCSMNGADPNNPPNAAWYYAPNKWVQNDLDCKGKVSGL